MTTARHADLRDVPRIMKILHAMHGQSRYAKWPINDEKLEALVCTLIGNRDGVCLLAVDGDLIVGVMMGLVTEFFFSRERVVTELLIYVLPSHRGTWAALRLGHQFIKWAKNTDAVEIQAGITAGIDDASAERFYMVLGFSDMGRSFAKGLDHVRA